MRLRLFALSALLFAALAVPAAAQISFSRQPGFASGPFTLMLSSGSDGEIRYTLDGSEPTAASKLYTAGIPILSRAGEPNGISMISQISTSYATWAPPVGEVFKATVVRAAVFVDGERSGRIVTNTYFVTPEGLARYRLPVVSLATDSLNLFGHDEGIYVLGRVFDEWRAANPGAAETISTPANYTQSGGDWERPVHIEIFEENNRVAISQDAGLRLHGSGARQMRLKSFRLYAKDDYGPDYFEYPLFPDKDMPRFKRFILRNGGQDFTKTMIRDGFMHRLVQDLSFDTMHYRPVVVFVNGEFWGIMNLRDRFDDHFIETHHGVDRDDIDFLEQNGAVQEGENGHYIAMRDFIADNPMSVQANFDYVSTQMDPVNFGEYNMSQIYFNNRDWPHNNIEYWRKRTDAYEPDAPYGHDGRWRWMLKDADFGFGWNLGADAWKYDMVGWAIHPQGTQGYRWSTLILRSLVTNPGYRNWFVTRFADLLNSHFRPDRVLGVLEDVSGTIQPHIQEHIDRWGFNDDRWAMPRTEAEWQANLDLMRHFATHRSDEIRKQLVNHFNLAGMYDLTVNRPPSIEGQVRVNSLPLTIYTHGVQDQGSQWRGVYFKGMDLTLVAKAAYGYEFLGWSGDVDATADSIVIRPGQDITVTPIFAKSTSIGGEAADLPQAVRLFPNYPNPFNPSTTVQWEQSKTGPVRLRVFDALGREVATLADGRFHAGTHSLAFDGAGLSSGVYLLRLEAGGMVAVQKMALLK